MYMGPMQWCFSMLSVGQLYSLVFGQPFVYYAHIRTLIDVWKCGVENVVNQKHKGKSSAILFYSYTIVGHLTNSSATQRRVIFLRDMRALALMYISKL